ncbi:MAG: hypothetical protein Q9196_001190 [Gyalolechia fulgens]
MQETTQAKPTDEMPMVRGKPGGSGPTLRGGSLSANAVHELEQLLPRSRFNPTALDSVFPKKRKGVVPAVDLSRMTTVHEICLDSPTIPGRPPLVERSMTLPTAVTLRRLSEEPNQTTPRVSEFSNPQMDQDAHATSQAADSATKLTKRSPLLTAKALAPLIIPPISPKDQKPVQFMSSESSERRLALPPRVPPKSPRTESKASPRPENNQHSAHSRSVSTSHSATSSATSLSNLSGRASPRFWSGQRRTDSPESRSSPKSTVESVPPESMWTKLFRLDSPSRRKKAMGTAEKGSPYRPEVPSTNNPIPLAHSGGALEASAVTRGRLQSKESLAFQSDGKPTVRSPSSDKRDHDLPTGFKATEAPHLVADLELRSLKQQADEQASHFKVLQAKDVTILSKELHQLDDRCQYLQRTYQSLRKGRKSLHDRMISYLKSPHMSNFSRESILKQEEALAEIDESIDDWIRKSEQAENRRSRVRQKLLEHVAAALTLRPNGSAIAPKICEEQTPPESPEQGGVFCPNERRDVQSIRIYADAGVAALLAEIEQEIGSMDQ